MELKGKLQRDMNRVKVLKEGEMMHLGKARDGSSHGGKLASPQGEGQELNASWHNYNQRKIKIVIQISRCFTKGLKSKSKWRLLGFCLIFKRR